MEPIEKTRLELLQKHPWYGALSMRLKFEPATDTPTMDVDGTTLKYNRKWFDTLSKPNREFYLAHQITRCALLHPFRCGRRDLEKWNEASALVVNATLKDSFTLPPDARYDPQYAGLAADTVYAKLSRDEKQNTPQAPKPQPKPQPTVSKGKAEAPGDKKGKAARAELGNAGKIGKPQATPKQSETDWRQAVLSADMVTKKAGKHPGDANGRATKLSRDAAADWRMILREFMEANVPKDYSWGNCNRRFIGQGIYLPGIMKENNARVGVVVDTSGSISARVLEQFSREISGIHQETRPSSLELVYADAKVRHVETFGPDDELTINALGGGGTLFQPALDYLTRPDAEEPCACIVYLSDLDNGGERLADVGAPVLWITSEHVSKVMPIGQTIRIPDLDF